MKTRLSLLAGLLLAFCGASLFAAAPAKAPGNAAKASATPPISPRFLQVRDKINGLFQHRNVAPPALDPLGNPFRPPGPIVMAAAPGGALVPVTTNDLSLLQEAAAALKVSGTVEKDGQPHLIINTRPYRRGDVVPSRADGQTVYLRIREITRRSVTFELNDTEMTLKF